MFPYPVDYGEGPLLDQTLRLANFQNIYRPDLAIPPYTISNYPPLYLLLQVPFVWLFGSEYWYGRLISWLSTLVSAGCLCLILHTFTRKLRITLLGGCLFLAIPYVSYWSPLCRVDALALGLSLAGLCLLVRWPPTRWNVVLTTLFLIAAIYTRQSYGLAAPLTAFVWLWSSASRRRAIEFAALMIGCCLSFLLFLQYLTDGGFTFNIITANLNEFQWDRLGAHLLRLFLFLPCLLVFSFRFVFSGKQEYPALWRFAIAYLLGATLSGLTIGKIGSNVNYFLELSAALSLTTAAFMFIVTASATHSLLKRLLRTGFILQILWLIVVSLFYQHFFVTWKIERKAEVARLMQIVQQAKGPVLADEFMGLPPLTNHPLYIQPFELTQLVRAGVWDQTPLLEAIQRQEFSAILIYKSPYYDFYKDRWTPEMLSLIEQYYREAQYFADTAVYRLRLN